MTKKLAEAFIDEQDSGSFDSEKFNRYSICNYYYVCQLFIHSGIQPSDDDRKVISHLVCQAWYGEN
ncbi:MAG: hypothetical protein WCR67_05845 [Bacilli bacterium]